MDKIGVKIAVIGGGTGSFTLLSQLKHYTKHVTALVNMADDGGSTGMLRDELGVLPPGDVRQCLVALSESERVRDLFNYRFDFGTNKRPEMELHPKAVLNPAARDAIMHADLVVIAPGNVYGSLAPALVVPGMSEALVATKAKKIYVCNLVTKPGQTDNFDVSDYASEIERFGKFTLDYVLYNDDKPSDELLERYAKDGEFRVEYDTTELKKMHYKAIGGSFIRKEPFAPAESSDPIAHTRTLIRHDATAVAKQLMRIYFA